MYGDDNSISFDSSIGEGISTDGIITGGINTGMVDTKGVRFRHPLSSPDDAINFARPYSPVTWARPRARAQQQHSGHGLAQGQGLGSVQGVGTAQGQGLGWGIGLVSGVGVNGGVGGVVGVKGVLKYPRVDDTHDQQGVSMHPPKDISTHDPKGVDEDVLIESEDLSMSFDVLEGVADGGSEEGMDRLNVSISPVKVGLDQALSHDTYIPFLMTHISHFSWHTLS